MCCALPSNSRLESTPMQHYTHLSPKGCGKVCFRWSVGAIPYRTGLASQIHTTALSDKLLPEGCGQHFQSLSRIGVIIDR